MKIVILAGGSGTRLWPMSRKNRAKQFNALMGEETMLETTLDRFSSAYPQEKIYISTTPRNQAMVEKILPHFRRENIIVEPEMRDTAAAMGYVASFLNLEDPDEPLAFVASDHFIRRKELFLNTLKIAEKEIEKTKKMVDISVVPDCPSTALGYTKVGKMVKAVDGVEIYEFLGHKEKPDYKTVQKYLKAGDYLWHCNFYMWTPRLFLEAFRKYAPQIHGPLKEIGKLFGKKGSAGEIKKQYARIPKIMIDYAVTEKMDPKDILIIKGEFGWSDIGSWDVLHKKLSVSADEKGNLVKGNWVGLDTSNSLIYSYPHKIVGTIGVDDLVVIDTPDALLVCPKGRTQEVKKIVEKIRKKKQEKYL